MSDEEKKPLNIYQRLNEVRKAVAYIRKEKEVTGAGTYMVVTHDQVTGELREHLIAQSIMVVPKLTKSTVAQTGSFTKSNIPIIRYEASYDIGFVNCDDPQDRVTVTVESHATDQGDKAPGKAISYAVKMAFLKLFTIETGVDEEERLQDLKGHPKEKQTHSATDGSLAALSPEDQIKAKRIANNVVDLWIDEKPVAAYEQVYASAHPGEMILAIWEILKPHSEIRSALKKMKIADSNPQTEEA